MLLSNSSIAQINQLQIYYSRQYSLMASILEEHNMLLNPFFRHILRQYVIHINELKQLITDAQALPEQLPESTLLTDKLLALVYQKPTSLAKMFSEYEVIHSNIISSYSSLLNAKLPLPVTLRLQSHLIQLNGTAKNLQKKCYLEEAAL